jgi:hypothetical protein
MSQADGILENMSARMRSPVLVGRAEHLSALDAALDRARAGGPSTLLIGGEARIGKSAWRTSARPGAGVRVAGWGTAAARGSRGES